MEDRLKAYGYQITTDSQFQNIKYGITPELDKQLESLAVECQNKKNKKIIDKLTQLVIQYPGVPMLKNYLSVAHNVKGNYNKAIEVNKWLVTEHPDYLFAKINQAHACIFESKFEKVPEILGEKLEIKQLYPERDLFHLNEITGFLKVVIRYYAATENFELAENRMQMLREIAPNHPDTEHAESFLFPLQVKKALERWQKKTLKRISAKQGKTKKVTNKKDAPQFNHPEINNLYHYGLEIPHDILEIILALPRLSLLEDLEMVIQDATERFDYFTELEYDEKTHSFLLHALFLLKELKAVESLPLALSVLASDSEFLGFWLGNHKTETIWQCFYELTIGHPHLLKPFLLATGIDTYSKAVVSEALSQMALHHPQMREEIAALYSEILVHFSETSLDDNLIDSEFLGLMIDDIINCQMVELLPIIKTLYEKEYVALDVNGDFNEVIKEFRLAASNNYKREVYTIFELYDHVLSTWFSYNEEKNDGSGAVSISEQAISEKVGRNDPCPCGSGKKYKKCCGKI